MRQDNDHRIPYYLIANVGTLVKNPFTETYPYHLMLAQQFEDANNAAFFLMVEICANIRKACEGHQRIILDNGLYEERELDASAYLNIIFAARPDVIILPDRINISGEASRDVSMDFLHRASNDISKMIDYPPTGYRPEYMYVPQGRTVEENLHEYVWAIQNLDCERVILGIGLAYKLWCPDERSRKVEDGRFKMVEQIMQLPGHSRWRFHLLGARWHSTCTFSRWKNIVGLDSFKPCRCAAVGDIYPTHDNVEKDFDHSSLEAVDPTLLIHNVSSFAEQYQLRLG